MIRYVNLGNQLRGEYEDGFAEAQDFAFYNTVTDRFITIDDMQAFETVADLRAACVADPKAGYPIERLLPLMAGSEAL